MVKNILAVLCVSLACSKTVPPVPGHLGVQFAGMWKTQPVMRVQDQPYPFLVRLTGFIPPEAYMLVVENNYGHLIASSPIKYQDVMQANPIRNYQFGQRLQRQGCDWLRNQTERDLKPRGDLKLEYTDGPQTYQVVYIAKVITQTKKVLAQASYTVNIHCQTAMGV